MTQTTNRPADFPTDEENEQFTNRRYKVSAKLDAPAGANTDGYSVYDYFDTDILGLYGTREMAQEVAEVGYKGRDEHGVGCTWTIDEVIL